MTRRNRRRGTACGASGLSQAPTDVSQEPEKSPTGIVRGKYQFDAAGSAVGSLNQKLDEAIDVVQEAFAREKQLREAEGMTREDDAKRAPALDNPRGVH